MDINERDATQLERTHLVFFEMVAPIAGVPAWSRAQPSAVDIVRGHREVVVAPGFRADATTSLNYSEWCREFASEIRGKVRGIGK